MAAESEPKGCLGNEASPASKARQEAVRKKGAFWKGKTTFSLSSTQAEAEFSYMSIIMRCIYIENL
jgi:hypothetical protein